MLSSPSRGRAEGWWRLRSWPLRSRCPPPGSWSQWGTSRPCRRTQSPRLRWPRTCRGGRVIPGVSGDLERRTEEKSELTESWCRSGSEVPCRNAQPIQARPAIIWRTSRGFIVMMRDHSDLADREDGSPSPALHHHHAEDVAGDINQDAK